MHLRILVPAALVALLLTAGACQPGGDGASPQATPESPVAAAGAAASGAVAARIAGTDRRHPFTHRNKRDKRVCQVLTSIVRASGASVTNTSHIPVG